MNITETDNKQNEPDCGPGCDCETPARNTKGKAFVCIVVALAAAIVLARGFAQKPENGTPTFSTDLSQGLTEKPSSPNNSQSTATLWGEPLQSMKSLNTVAIDKDAVFVLFTSEDEKDNDIIKEQINAAAAKITAKGTTLAAFTFDKTSAAYEEMSKQLPKPPCVLTISKGGGMKVIAKDITEANLLEALIETSRPSECGAGGCGPGGCN